MQAAATADAAGLGAADQQQDKRDRIIERAVKLFNELGFDRVRVGDITDSLNMGKGTFYLYFQNKKELLLTCFEHIMEQIQVLESLPVIREGDFFTRVGPRMETVHTLEWWPGVINLLRAAELSPDAEIKSKAREAYEVIAAPLRRDLEAATQSGQARDADAELAAYGFVGLAENLFYRSRLDERYPPEEVVAFMVDAVTRWLASGEPAEKVFLAPNTAAHILDRGGMEFDLDDIRCDGKAHLTGSLGLAQLDIDLARVSSLVVGEPGDECLADVTTADGTEVRLRVDGSIVISGTSLLGTVRIAMRDVSNLTRR